MNKVVDRLQKIISYIEAHGYSSVKELSHQFNVSEMTIRRDLSKLEQENRIIRVFGGGAPNPKKKAGNESGPQPIRDEDQSFSLFNNSDVLITTLFNPKYDPIIFGRDGKPKYPIVAESVFHKSSLTCVGIDNFAAAFQLGQWAGKYSLSHFAGKARVLDLTYHLSNTKARSQGFLDGLAETLPAIDSVISLNPQSRFDKAYQLTREALEANDEINIIFAINDANAWGAIQACRDLKMDPKEIIVIAFGLEGDTIKNALFEDLYCKVTVAMFPEIVGQACIDAAILAYRKVALPEKTETPFAIITKETLTDYYTKIEGGWDLRWELVHEKLKMPVTREMVQSQRGLPLPKCIGILIPFPEHEWYQNLISAMNRYAIGLNIKTEILDAEQNLKDEMEYRNREIARRAVQEINFGDTVFIDGGITAQYMSDYLNKKTNCTVITNSMDIFASLESDPEITLISTGGVLHRNSRSLVGPLAENSLKEIRVDKLFLTVSGVSLDFGLSHSNVSEVTIKQAMIRSAQKVILLADHTKLNQESLAQIAPFNVVDLLITDNGMPAGILLQLNKAGIDVIITPL